jgi:hypothetical protein
VADLDALLAVATPDPVARNRQKHPDGWEPGVDTARGVIVAEPSEDPAPPTDWGHVLEQFHLDPERWEVVDDQVNVRTWDANVGGGVVRRFFYYRANVRPRTAANVSVDVEALCRQIARHRYRRPTVPVGSPGALVVCLADWQAGPDPQGLVDHVLNLKTQIVDRLKAEKPETLYVVGMGDMIEACDGHYAMQTYATAAGGLNGRRDQVKLVRRLLVDLLTTWARYAPKVVVGCVPGNHGENRRDGKAYTTFEDNDDLAVFEQAGEILAANADAYDHVRFVIPDGDMALVLEVAGTVVGFIHGHQARKGATPQAKLTGWWKDRAHGGHPIGDATVLVSGHYHHAIMVEDGPKTWMQCPALAHSRWWEESGGQPTRTGTLTFAVGPEGWDGYRLIR